MPSRTKRSSAKCTPPLLRNCTGALWPRKKTRSGKIFGVIAAALRITCFPSAGGLPAIAVCRCWMENVRSNTDSTTKYFVKRAMETPFRMRASYNISPWHGKRYPIKNPAEGRERLGIEARVTQVSRMIHHDSRALWHRSPANERFPTNFVRAEEQL